MQSDEEQKSGDDERKAREDEERKEREEREILMREVKTRHDQGLLLDIPQSAILLGLSTHTMRRWVLERKLEFLKIGAAVRIESATLDEIVAERRVPAAK